MVGFFEFYGSCENYEQLMVDKIAHGEPIDESDLERLVYDNEIDRIESENKEGNCSSIDVISIITLRDRYFAINWQRSLVDGQPIVYNEYPNEVSRKNVGNTYEWVVVA